MGKIKISSQLIADEAQSRGWDVHFFDVEATSLMRITPPGEEPRLFKSTVTMLDSYVGGKITDSKYETYLVLKDAGLPVPDTKIYSKTDIKDFISNHSRVVVKPVACDHGDGITINVSSVQEANNANDYAKQFSSKDILIQEQIPGYDHRMLVIGTNVFVAKRRKPIVVGDGLHTVRELVEIKNTDPRRGAEHSKPLSLIDLDQVKKYLGEAMEHVPPKGDVLEILGTSNLSSGGESIELSKVAHHSFCDYARNAAQLLGLRVCAVDIMCKDITKPAGDQKHGIIEMNVLPGIRMHHFPVEGEPVNVASAILDEVFRSNT